MKKLILIICIQFIPISYIFSTTMSGESVRQDYFADFYVSTQGNDNWSGKLAVPNIEKTDGPFATVGRAKQAVRIIKRGLYRNIYVLIRGGEFKLQETVIFTPEDSHYVSYSIVYMAYPGEQPVFSSDVLISAMAISG